MRFSLPLNPVTQCASGGHRHIQITVGAQTRTLHVGRDDMQLDASDLEEAILGRIRSALKEGGANMALTSWNLALGGKEFQV